MKRKTKAKRKPKSWVGWAVFNGEEPDEIGVCDGQLWRIFKVRFARQTIGLDIRRVRITIEEGAKP